MSSFDSIVMRARESTPNWLPVAGRSGFRARRPAAPDQRSAGTGAGSRPSAQRAYPALVVGLSRHLPSDRRPRRSHPGGRGPAAVRGPASAPGLPVGRRGQVGCRAAEGDSVRGRADVGVGGAGTGQLGRDPPRVDRHRDNVRQPTIPGQGQGDVARLALGVRPPRIGLPAKGRGLRACDPQAEPSQSNQRRSSADSCVSRCGAKTITQRSSRDRRTHASIGPCSRA